jgi:cytochrome P450
MTETLSSAVDAGVEPPLFPMKRTCPFHLPQEYERLREEEPVSVATFKISGRPVYLVSRQEDVRQILSDPTLSSNWKNRAYPLPLEVPDEILDFMDLPLIALDPPEHTGRRRLLVPEFTAKRIEALRPRIQAVVDEVVAGIVEKGPPADLMAELAVPTPALVFAEILGIPVEHTPALLRNATMTASRDTVADDLFNSHMEIAAVFGELIERKTAQPGDDLISRLIERNAALEEPYEEEDLISLLEVLLVGGLDTVASNISTGVAALLAHPDQLAQIKQDPALTRTAVHELLRFLSVSDAVTARVATRDLEIAGTVIPAGSGIIALNGSANHDPRAWQNPDELDVRRDAKGHSGFGHGIHQCLGAGLAQTELEIVFNTLFARLPELRLAVPVDELPFKHDTVSYGLYELPVTW